MGHKAHNQPHGFTRFGQKLDLNSKGGGSEHTGQRSRGGEEKEAELLTREGDEEGRHREKTCRRRIGGARRW
jgi:hypothetical protein